MIWFPPHSIKGLCPPPPKLTSLLSFTNFQSLGSQYFFLKTAFPLNTSVFNPRCGGTTTCPPFSSPTLYIFEPIAQTASFPSLVFRRFLVHLSLPRRGLLNFFLSTVFLILTLMAFYAAASTGFLLKPETTLCFPPHQKCLSVSSFLFFDAPPFQACFPRELVRNPFFSFHAPDSRPEHSFFFL